MARLWPVLVIVAAAVVLVVFVFGGDEAREGTIDGEESYLDEEEHNPELLAAEAVRRRQEADAEAARRAAEARRGAPEPSRDVTFLRGTVVSAATGRPLAGALLFAQVAAQPCPRLPQEDDFRVGANPAAMRIARTSPLSPSSASATPEGRFDWRVDPATARLQPYDVFVSAPGHVTQVLCRPAVGGEVTVRLPKAVPLDVLVTDRHGRPVEGASVMAMPGPDTPAVPGHAGRGRSDKEGRCAIDGLLPGGVMIVADHPDFMPVEEGPVDPALQPQVELRLPPAMRLTFTLRSDDASEIQNPTLQWRTDGTPPHEQLLLLATTPSGPEDAPTSEVKSQAVRIPCDHRNVFVELKADGFAPWKAAPEPLPPEGGTKDMIAVLSRDTSLSSLRVRFESPEGEAVSFAAMKGVPTIQRLDPKDPGPVVVETSDVLTFPALPAGPYRIGVRCPEYAPVEQELQVVAGEDNEVTVRLRPPAKLRVRFTYTERVMVRFRLRRDGSILAAFPIREGPDGTTVTGLEPLEAQAEEGALFGGLGAGAATIEVTNPELVAPARTVQLREGETTEVEIEVRER